MKSLIRKSATALAVGGFVLGSMLAAGLEAIALTSEQIIQQLRSVPVFTITDDEGSPLVSEITQNDDVAPVTQVFMSQADAEAFIEGLRTEAPDLAGSVQVRTVPLSAIYEIALRGQDPENRLEFILVPEREQVQSAVTILQEETGAEEPIEEFSGVPLFTARSSDTTTEDEVGYLTIQQGEQEVIPIFFAEDDLNALLAEIEQTQPDLAGTLEPHVIRLEDLIYTLETSDNEALQQIRLFPSSETLQFLRNQQGE